MVLALKVQMRKHLIIVFSTAFTLRLIWLLIIYFSNYYGIYFSDSFEYLSLADNLKQLHIYSREYSAPYYPEFTRTPGYPVFILLVKSIFTSEYFVSLFQVIISSISAVLFYKLLLKLYSNSKLAFAGSLIYAVSFSSIIHSALILSDTLLESAICLMLYFLIRGISDKSFKHILLGGLVLAIAVMIKPVAAVIFFGLPILLVMFFRNKFYVKGFLLFFATTLIFISPWTIRNYLIYTKAFVSGVSDINLYYFRAAEVHSVANNIPFDKVQADFKKDSRAKFRKDSTGVYERDIIEYSNQIRGDAIEIISKNFPITIYCSVKGALKLFLAPPLGAAKKSVENFTNVTGRNVNTKLIYLLNFRNGGGNVILSLALLGDLFVLILVFFALLAGIKNFGKRQKVLIIILLFVTLACSGIEADARLRLAIWPIELALALPTLMLVYGKISIRFHSKK